MNEQMMAEDSDSDSIIHIVRPDWNFWTQIIDTELAKAVVLSCNCEPRSTLFFQPWNRSEGQNYDDEFEASNKIFWDRIAIAVSHLTRSGTLLPKWTHGHDAMMSGVNLAAFAAWAKGLGWDIPSELESMSANDITNSVKSESTSDGSRDSIGEPKANKGETATLNIIGALCELYWQEIRDTNDKDIVQSRIIERILKEFPRTFGLSERNLKGKISVAISTLRGSK
jgi:hypothetical protein